MKNLNADDFKTLLRKFFFKMNTWDNKTCSWIGRVHIIKKAALLLNYFINIIPCLIQIRTGFYSELKNGDKKYSDFNI